MHNPSKNSSRDLKAVKYWEIDGTTAISDVLSLASQKYLGCQNLIIDTGDKCRPLWGNSAVTDVHFGQNLLPFFSSWKAHKRPLGFAVSYR